MRLANKVAVVLGASAQGGTGWAIAEGLAREGARVVVGARRIEPLRELAERIGGLAVACDASKEEQVAAFAQAAVEAYGPIDIAVNSAGRPVLGTIAAADHDRIRRSLAVDFFGNAWFVRYMAQAMSDGGSIVLISSSSSAQPVLPFFPYGCAKAATDCLVRYAAVEFGGRGIRVNSILPGPIKTELARQLFEAPGAEEVFAREIPLTRVGEPADFADAVLWLADRCYASGLNLPVSGGMQLMRAPRADEMPDPEAFDGRRLSEKGRAEA
jgi:NAD(P)-dependent dehydrogenase (short-subunit alcohol dehydrogenase family)